MQQRKYTGRRIEEMALNAWPAPRQILYDGWLVRLGGGYTKRANSVNLLYPGHLDLREKVNWCETFYRQAGQPAIFRLTSLDETAALDRLLANRGYTRIAPSSVLVSPSRPRPDETSGKSGCLKNLGLDHWLDLFHRYSETVDRQKERHRAILEHIATQRWLVALMHDERPVACGMAVREGDCLGLFDLVTDPDNRRQGYGRRLMHLLMDRAARRGVDTLYLQVVDANRPAGSLYTGLEFKTLYRYWYRVAPA